MSFPRCGNGLCKPLDSGLRRNDGVAADNDGEGGCCWAQGCRDSDKPISTPIVIPAQAGIQETGARLLNGWPILADGALGGSCLSGHSHVAGMYGFNHWIPACAGMTQWLRGMTAGAVGCCRAQGCRDGDKPISTPIVIPAQAGIQETGARW